MTHRREFLAGLLGGAVLGALAAVPATGATARSGSYSNLDATALKEMLEAKKFFFANVHIPYEGEIPQTDAFIPFNEIEKQVHRLPQEKDAKIVLYCMSDRMSTIAAEKLVRLGYTNVWNLDGGMVDWQARGYALIQRQGR